MKWNGFGRGAMASVAALAMGLGLSSCSRDYTVAYVYVTASTTGTAAQQAGVINAYAVDYQSGALTQLADSPVPSGGRNPVHLAIQEPSRSLIVANYASGSIARLPLDANGRIGPLTELLDLPGEPGPHRLPARDGRQGGGRQGVLLLDPPLHVGRVDVLHPPVRVGHGRAEVRVDVVRPAGRRVGDRAGDRRCCEGHEGRCGQGDDERCDVSCHGR